MCKKTMISFPQWDAYAALKATYADVIHPVTVEVEVVVSNNLCVAAESI